MQSDNVPQVWVYGDLRNEKYFGFSLNVLAKARELACALSGQTVMLLIGSSDDGRPQSAPAVVPCLEINASAQLCLQHGADRVYQIDHSALGAVRADLYARVLTNAVTKHNPRLVLFALTDLGRELAARTARLHKAGLIAECLDLRLYEGEFVASCPSWGGEIMAEITFTDPSQTGFATVQPHVAAAVKKKGDPGLVQHLDVEVSLEHSGVTLLSSALDAQAQRKLEEAEIVVVGGAGLGTMEGFAMARELAAAMGGQLGATRPPVVQHWVDEERLIGQTGKTVRPKLLLSIGTSGAVQYTAGIMEAETIVAINRDPQAPIFQIADWGLVADARTLLPLLITQVKQVVMRELADLLCAETCREPGEGFGARVCKLREAHDYSIEALAKATGQTPEFIEQIESETFSPSVSFLLRLAKALDVDPGTFLSKAEQAVIVGQRAKSFIKRTRNYSYQTLTPQAENSHLRAFLITIESKRSHKPVEYKHEGEEFIFVMEGELQMTLGGKVHKLKSGESIHFNSEIAHELKSLSNQNTRCLVVLFTP